MNPFCCSTAHASSIVTVFMRSRMSSGTLGRPSGNRSPCQSGVYLITSSAVKKPCWAPALATLTAARTMHRPATHACLVLIMLTPNYWLCCGRLKPGCPRDLGLLRGFLIHLNSQARFLAGRNVTLLDDLAFLDPVLP